MIKRFHSNLFFVSDLERTAEFYEKLGFDYQIKKKVFKLQASRATGPGASKSSQSKTRMGISWFSFHRLG